MPDPALPSYDDVLVLPSLIEGKVCPDFIDVNGHMNIRHYIEAGATSADMICRETGIDDHYRRERGLGVFTAEHHLRYFAEMREGAAYSVHTRYLDRSEKVGHLIAFILDRSRGVVTCTMEIVLVHVDMDSRRPAPFPQDVATRMDRWIAESEAVSWEAPTCGAMGVRH